MVNRSANKYRKPVIPPRDKRTMLVAIALALTMLGGGAVLARRGSLWPAMSQNSSGKQESVVSPEGFAASSPAKEYVYARIEANRNRRARRVGATCRADRTHRGAG
jgi:hypothetical protein